MNLLATFEKLIEGWRDVFPQERTFQRARRLVFGLIVSLRLHLTSNAICATGRQFVDWSADYRLCSRSPWDPHRLFDPIFDYLPQLLDGPKAPVLMALDDTMCKKSSPRIPGVSMGRDPMSPAFRVNFCYGVRFVQASILVTSKEGGAARALPVRFDFAPPAKKPRQTHRIKIEETIAPPEIQTDSEAASPASGKELPPNPTINVEAEKQKQEWEEKLKAYRQEKKEKRLPRVGMQVIGSVRESLDQRPETRDRILIVSGDGSYTTKDVVRGLPERTTYIGRIRKDAKLHYALEAVAGKPVGRPKRYGVLAPTPEQILRDDSIETLRVRCFAAGKFHDIPLKVRTLVYWRNSGCDLPLKVVVIKPLGYRLRKGSRLLYRKPAFLICTDLNLDLQTLIQAYVYRWEIECNHRDEKSLLGVAQGQVWNPDAVRRLPQLQVASYSLLLLASLLSSGFQRTGDYLPLPKWRRKSTRPSLMDILNLMRSQIFARGIVTPVVSFDAFASAATPSSLKPSKSPLAAETVATTAA
jgi:DDE superfamily endonuclease